jgi:hypothetical protein
MVKDNQPKHRQQARDLRRLAARRAPFERILIVSEGEKTEPHYFREIRNEYRLSTANVEVLPSADGTEPLQIVEYAEKIFKNGDRRKQIEARAFDRIFAVFDRDAHVTYHEGLAKAASLDNRLKNSQNQPVRFHACASVPNFELWLLLHFEDVQAPLHRNEIYRRLKQHLTNYDKGQAGYWEKTKQYLDIATKRAQARANATSAHHGTEPFTGIYELVNLLIKLRES